MDNLIIMRECVSIARGEHPAWQGDRIANADTYLWRIGHDMPEEAAQLAADLSANVSDYSEELGVSPDRVRYYANRLLDGIKSGHITAFYKNRTGRSPSTFIR